MMWAVVTRVPDILQGIGLVVVVAAAIYVALKIAKGFRSAVAYVKR